MTRKIVWSAAAKHDYLEIVRYIAERNPDAALRVAGKIDRAVTKLADMATGRQGRVTDTFEKMVPTSPYIVAYEMSQMPDGQERIVVLHVIHGARDWPDEAWPKD